MPVSKGSTSKPKVDTPLSDVRPSANLNKLLDHLSFTAEGVVAAALEGPSLFEEAARYNVAKMRRRSSCEMDYDRIKAEAELAIRRDAAALGDKITEGNIKAKLATDNGVLAAQELFNNAEADEAYSKLLVEAYRIRRDALKAIVDLTGAERAMSAIVENNTRSLDEASKKLQKKYGG